MRIDSYNQYNTLTLSTDRSRKALEVQSGIAEEAIREESRAGKGMGETTGQVKLSGEETMEGSVAAAGQQEIKDEVILSEEAKCQSGAGWSQAGSSMTFSTGSPSDDSALLTQRLVRATTQMEVIEIRSKALGSLASLRIIAGTGSEEDAKEAKSIIKKLEKLVKRSHRKIKDLSKEESLRLDENRAVQTEKKDLAEKIEKELRRREIERKAREQSYLNEEDEIFGNMVNGKKRGVSSQLSSSEEARIERMAKMQAAAEISVSGAGGAAVPDTSGAVKENAGTEVSKDMGAGMLPSGPAESIDISV